MQIIDIYKKYHIPQQLQLHMLRVAACSNLILDNFEGKKINNVNKSIENLDKEIKFKLPLTQLLYINKFGLDDHQISLAIGKELGLSDYELQIMQGKESKRNEEIMNSDSFEIKICAYCDERVSPTGVESIQKRLEDAKKRYKGTSSIWGDEKKADYLIECALEIEKQIIQYCSIKPEDINDDSIKEYIEVLKGYKITSK